MLRLFTSRCCSLLLKSAIATSQKEVSCFLRINRIKLYRRSIPVNHFHTGIPDGKDTVKVKGDESDETETVDLDKWKSVMISQTTFHKEKLCDEVGSSEEMKLNQTGTDSKDSPSLEPTRELVSMWRQAGKLVPQQMTEDEVQTLANLTTKSSRKKYLKYLAIKEGHKLARKEKQQQKRTEREASLEEKREVDSEGEDHDGNKLKNTIFLQFWGRSLDKLLAWRTAQAMLFGQPLVFDMSYESNMSRREIENTVSQLLEVEGWNRRATEPFHLHFCNLQSGGLYMKELLKRYGADIWERLLLTSTEKQYIDLFPREQLVYLTADSPNVLRTFDHSKVYIIGALVDRSIQSGLSLANAKRLKLATARLPLDEFLHWDIGAKNLTLDQMIRIMLTIKDTGKWEEALKFVPTRKHDGFHQQQTRTENANNRARSVTNHGWTGNSGGPLMSKDRDNGRIFKSQNTHKSSKEFGLTGRKNSPATTKVRSSFKTNMEAKKSARGHKMWQDE